MLKKLGLTKAFLLFLVVYAGVGLIAYYATKVSLDYRSRAGFTQDLTTVLRVRSNGDVANQDGRTYEAPRSLASWIGTGAHSEASYLGLRFVGLRLPVDAQIVSAVVQVVASVDQSGSMVMAVGAQNSTAPERFSRQNPPSDRVLIGEREISRQNEFWKKDAVYAFDVSETVKELYGAKSPDGTVALIFRGKGSTYGRKFFYNGTNNRNTPTLTVTYKLPVVDTPTPTPEPVTPSPTSPLLRAQQTSTVTPEPTLTSAPSMTPTPTRAPTPKPTSKPTPTPYVCIEC